MTDETKHPRDMTNYERAAGIRKIQTEYAGRQQAAADAKLLETLKAKKESAK